MNTDPFAKYAAPTQSAPASDPFAKYKSGGEDKPLSWGDVAGQAVTNVPSSAVQTGKALASPFLHPVTTAEDLYHLGAGVLEEASGSKTGTDEKYVESVKNYYKDRYGSEEGLKRAIATDPIGVLTDASAVFGGGEFALAKTTGKLGEIGEVLGKAAKATNPLTPVAALAKKTGQATATMRGKIADALVTRGAELFPKALEARKAGYVIPPSLMAKNPGALSKVMSDIGGDTKTKQFASIKNQDVTQHLAKDALGVPQNTQLTPQTFDAIRANAGKAYQDLENSVHMIYPNSEFTNSIKGLGAATSEAAKYFPKYVHNAKIEDLSKELSNTQGFSPRAGLEMVKRLRFNSNDHLHAKGDPELHALGISEREAADSIDKLIGDNVAAFGPPDAFGKYQQARQTIAKSYDLEAATNMATGEVDANKLGTLYRRGRPFTGPLKTIAETALAFPSSVQKFSKVGNAENIGPLDFFEASAAASTGHPGLAATVLAKPAVRATALSEKVQNRLAGIPSKAREPILTEKGKTIAKKAAPTAYEAGKASDVIQQLQGNFQ